jgi:hypothetical protein
MMQQAMDELRLTTEQTLAKFLSRGQLNRLRQIQLQLEGPDALVRRPEIAEKLNMDEAQLEQLRELRNERDQARRQSFAARGELFRQLRPNNQNQNGGGQQGGNNGGNNGGGNAGNGNGGRGNNRRFDPEAFRQFMERPEVKAKMEEFRVEQEKVQDQYLLAVNKILSPRQRANYKKMLGPPFDRSKMGPGPWGGPGGPRAAGNQANTKGAGTAAAKSGDDDDGDGENTAATKAPATKPAAKPAATTPAKKSRSNSLRAQRGLESSDDE